jgi:ABC-type transport system involved in multi-copper enzyme maturation permease subunit
MGIDIANYHGWQGELRHPVRGVFSIARVALLQVLRRKSYWLLLILGLAQFIMFWSVIYAVTQLDLAPDFKKTILREFGFSAQADEGKDNGYMMFMERQSVVVMILLAFSGSLLVGADFRQRTLPFYLSRRIGKRHYIVGKLLAVSSLILILTVFPALALFVEYGSFTSGWTYWIDNWRIPLGVLGYGVVLCLANSVWLVCLSAYLQRAAPIAITWSSLLIMPGRLGEFLWKASDNEYWRLLDPWRDMRLTGQLFFGKFRKDFDRDLAWWAMALIVAVTLIALLALVRRVRAVDVVE